jgi:hypothetical protein
MRDYSTFRSSFWTGETGKKLRKDPDAQRLAAYLITSPHANVIGFYWLPIQYAHMETGLSEEGVLGALRRLSEMGFAHYDDALEVVWVVNMAREQLGIADGGKLKPEDNRGKAARKAADTVKRSRLYREFHNAYAEALSLSPLQAPCKGVRTASEDQIRSDQIRDLSPAVAGTHADAVADAAAQERRQPRKVREPNPEFDAVVALVREEYARAYPDPKLRPEKLNGGLVMQLAKWAAGDLESLRSSLRAFLADPFWAAEGHPFATWAGDKEKYLRKAKGALPTEQRLASIDAKGNTKHVW